MSYTPDDDAADDWEIPDFGLDGLDSTGDDGDTSLDFLPGPLAVPDDHRTAVTPAASPAEPEPAVFSVTNPEGTVTAVAEINGKIARIEIGGGPRSAPPMTEAELAQEIRLVGRLASQKARSELFSYLVDKTAAAGQDPTVTGRFLRDDVGLPTPEQSAAAQAEAFGARYLETHD